MGVLDLAGTYLTIQDVQSETIITQVSSLHTSMWQSMDASKGVIITSAMDKRISFY